MRAYAEFELARLEVPTAVRTALEPLVLDALFEYAARQHTEAGAHGGTAQLTMHQALEVFAAQMLRWRDRLRDTTAPLGLRRAGLPADFAARLQALTREAHLFFRREGAGTFRIAAATPDPRRRFGILWTDVFSRCVLDWMREEDLLGHIDRLETADMLVECLKLWVRELAAHLGQPNNRDSDPSQFFLDLESDVSATFERGPVRLKIRGRLDALQLGQISAGLHATAFHFGDPERAELHLVQQVFLMAVIERTKSASCQSGTLFFFNPKPTAPSSDLPPDIDAAFTGYVGNEIAVARLKRRIARLREMSRAYIADNYLLTGAAGTGKTELARRIARALGVPFIPVSVKAGLTGEDVLLALDEALGKQDTKATASGEEGDKDVLTYPPVLIFLDDVHEMRNKADQFLNLLEPRDRRIFGTERVGILREATVVASTDDVSRLTEALQSRFRRIDVDAYREEEMAQIVSAAAQRAGVTLPAREAMMIARMGRCNPRRATAYANDLCVMHAAVPATAPISRETIMVLGRRDWKVDEHGLSDRDYQYLRALESGPKGLPALQQLLPVGGEDFVRVIEPYLIQLGAIQRTARGRMLTVLGEQLLYRRAALESGE